MPLELRVDRGVVIHGGVGTLPPEAMTEELEREYRAALEASLRAGHAVVEAGGRAVDAAVEAVRVMEDSPLFNAGRGSNFDERGIVTMDAAVMDGPTRDAGAVAGVTTVRNPVELARAVMEHSPHLLLIGEGAESFARERGVQGEDAVYFHTERRWSELQRAKRSGRAARPNVLGDEPAGDGHGGARTQQVNGEPETDPSGTVGAVVLDAHGALASATSTGGMANKSWGRIGDTPIVGAGTFASRMCAVSCTGWGEYFIRHVIAHDVHARMAHGGATLAEAVRAVVFDVLQEAVPASGGLVAIDADGHVELTFNTPGMYRGWIGPDGEPRVAIYGAP